MEDVYDMTFAEFQIRLFSWRRVEDRSWEKVRLLAWHISAASPNRKKAMPSLESFMPIGTDNPDGILTESQKKRFLEVSKEYYEQLNSK